MIQLALTNIGKGIKAVVVSSVTAAFLFSTLMFCCQVGLVHAQALNSKTASCCHVTKTGQLKAQDAKPCTCCHISKNSPDQAKKPFEITKPSGNSFYKIFLTVERFVYISHHRALFSLAYQGPPRTNASIPIYLQNSNLRL